MRRMVIVNVVGTSCRRVQGAIHEYRHGWIGGCISVYTFDIAHNQAGEYHIKIIYIYDQLYPKYAYNFLPIYIKRLFSLKKSFERRNTFFSILSTNYPKN